MTAKVRNRLIAVVALLAAGSGLAYLALGNLGSNLVYYWTPGEMISHGQTAYGPTIRLGGVVKPGTIQWDADKTELAFVVMDNHTEGAGAVRVHAREVPPQMFRDGIGVVVEGTYSTAGVFESSRLMINHSNEYRAPKGEERPKWDKSVAPETNTSTTRAP